jgi:hypothetical protein
MNSVGSKPRTVVDLRTQLGGRSPNRKLWRKIAKPQVRKDGVTLEQFHRMLSRLRARQGVCGHHDFCIFALARLSEVSRPREEQPVGAGRPLEIIKRKGG